LLAAIAAIGLSSSHLLEAKQMNTKSAVLQAVVDAPQLDKYFHADKLPERSPLRIVKGPWYEDDIQVQKFGKAVMFVPADAPGGVVLEIGKLAVSNDSAQVAFVYAVEGISGNAELQKTGSGWSVQTMKVRER
jgi:hypothetical protein